MFSDNRSTCALLCVAGLLTCESCLGHYQGFEISVSVQTGWHGKCVESMIALRERRRWLIDRYVSWISSAIERRASRATSLHSWSAKDQTGDGCSSVQLKGSTRWGVRLVRFQSPLATQLGCWGQMECVKEFYWGSWRSSPCEGLLLEGSADLGKWLKVSLRIEAAWFLSGQEDARLPIT